MDIDETDQWIIQLIIREHESIFLPWWKICLCPVVAWLVVRMKARQMLWNLLIFSHHFFHARLTNNAFLAFSEEGASNTNISCFFIWNLEFACWASFTNFFPQLSWRRVYQFLVWVNWINWTAGQHNNRILAKNLPKWFLLNLVAIARMA